MTAIKIKAASKSTNAPPADEAAPKSATAPISSGDDAAPPASSNANDRDNDSSIDDSSNGETFSGNEEAVVDGEVMAASVKGGGEEEEDANHDSNDAAGEERNVETTATDNAKEKKEEADDDVKEEDSPHDTEDAHVANATSGNEGQDEDAIDAEEKEEDGNEGEEDCPNVACSMYQSTHDTNCTNAYFSCLDCQQNNYGGWPEDKSDIPMAFRETIRQHCTRNPANAVFPDLPTSRNGEEEDKSDDEDAGEGEEKWDLIEVIAVKDLKKKKPKKCQEEGCTSAATIFRSLSRALFLIKVIVTLTLLSKVCELHSPLPTLEWTSSLSKPCEIQPSPHTPRYLRHVLPDCATPPPVEDSTSIDVDGPSETPLGGQGSLLVPDLLDALDPFSIGSFNYAHAKWSETSPMPPKLESFEDPIRNSYTNVNVNVLSDVSNVVDHLFGDEQVNFAESQMVGDEQVNFAEPDAKRQKVDSPTMSPTTQCNRDDYQRVRDPSAIAIRPSLPRAYSGNPAYTLLYQDASRDMLDIVNATDSDDRLTFVYDPESPDVPINVMTDVAHDITDWHNLQTTEGTLVIYAFVEDDSNLVDYVGYSRNYTRRLDEHQVTRGSEYFESHTAVRLVDYDNIHHDTDAALSDRITQFWSDVLDVPGLPPTLRRMYTNLSDQWHRGGPKKQKSGLMIETGTQLHYGVASPSEAFMYDEAKEHHLIDLATQAGEELVDIIDTVWGPEVTIQPDEPFAISTWQTGASEGTLSSCIVVIEYVLGNDNWENTTPEALFPNAETEAQIFAVPVENEAALGRFRFILIGYASIDGPAFVLVDAQDYMLTLIEAQMELCEMGYELVDSLLGGEIIVFRQNRVLVLLHGHPANTCDSRDSFSIISRQRRAVSMDALRIARQRAVGDTSDHRFDAIRGSIYAEISDVGWHGSKRFGAAICRDTMTKPDGVDAIAAFNGGKTPDDINYPTSDNARQRGRTREEWTIKRFTDQMSQTSIDNAVSMLNIHMERHGVRTNHVQGKWRAVIDSYRGNPELQRRVRTSVRALPSGGDVAPRRSSIERGNRLEQSITTYRDQHNGSLDNFKVWFVSSGESFEAEQFAGVEVHDMNTETNANTRLSGILGSFLNKRVSMQGLGVKFKKCTGAERIAFFQGTNLDHDTITNAELSIMLYKLVRK